ncbi:hypothetical protein ACTFIT_010005 [Dictyostelium discoideum]
MIKVFSFFYSTTVQINTSICNSIGNNSNKIFRKNNIIKLNSQQIQKQQPKTDILKRYYSESCHNNKIYNKNNNTYNNNNNNKMNTYSSLLFYNENNNKVLMVKNNINKLYKAVPHSFFGFPSLTSPEPTQLHEQQQQQQQQQLQQKDSLSNKNCCNNEKLLLNNKFYSNQLQLDKIEKVFNNKNSFKRDNIYYLGSLVTPYYLEQVKRCYFDYYLIIVKDSNCINKNKLETILVDSISPTDPASSGGTKEKTLEISMEWKEPMEFLREFNSHRKFITPETQYLLKMLSLFSKTNNDLLTISEDKNNLGITIPLEFAPHIESIPVRSNTLHPFNSTNLIISQNDTHILLVDPGANKEGSIHMCNIIEKKLLKYLKKFIKNNIEIKNDENSNNVNNEQREEEQQQQEEEEEEENKKILEGKNISIFITHNHKDHWEGIGILEKHFPEATIYAHEKTLKNIESGLKKVQVSGFQLKDKESVDSFLNEIKTPTEIKQLDCHTNEKLYIGNGGDRIFHIVSTPGHTDDSLCLFENNSKTLIAGDHIVGFGSSVLDFHTGDMVEYIDSTHGMINYLCPKVAIPAHGPLNFDPIVLLNNYIKHRLLREEEILNAYKSGKTSLTEILDIVYGSLEPTLSFMALGNIKLHLQKLQKENKI